MKKHEISAVSPGSIAEELGIQPGDLLVDIDGAEIKDILDYRYKTAAGYIELGIESAAGEQCVYEIEKDEDEQLGLEFEGIMSGKKGCANKCIFCFVDQLPPNVRSSLLFKDDDWRLSFLSGNYITLTNMGDAELDRIIEQHISPLYISVHTMDMQLRSHMLGSGRAARLEGQLQRLREGGINFHCQIVLLRDVNDGAYLEQTIRSLSAMRPYARDCAIVPIGLTAHRAGLCELRAFGGQSAAAVIDMVDGLNAELGEPFAYCADEFYVLSGRQLPAYEHYGSFGQLEDGIGMLRHFEHGFARALPGAQRRTGFAATIATGSAAYGFMRGIGQRAAAALGIEVDTVCVPNGFFGGHVSVSGLLTGSDYYNKLAEYRTGDVLLICRSSLRDEDDIFLDDMSLDELEQKLGRRIVPMPNDGAEWLRMLQTMDIKG